MKGDGEGAIHKIRIHFFTQQIHMSPKQQSYKGKVLDFGARHI